MRKLVLAVSMAVLAVLGAMPPATALAVDFEWDFAVAGTLPPRSQLTCHSIEHVEICWEKAGDHWWVQDQNSNDHASAGVRWFNERNGSLYRKGYCITSLGKGKWGHCNKDYYENSTLSGYPCVWDRSSGESIDCGPEGWRYQ